ncbi:hypothetical protein [Flavobacterium succinicans]|uniref:Uncharacterized protein n=1 Tax=Flavobacterium succinicans TaxID=29536 RepID=A0A199XQD3_9FLAO|nr:hypothetical protein [Flavobacterium succinicans]OAZ03627.1 hypothetical protein FLB_19030 [Flavobacterium succinicans]
MKKRLEADLVSIAHRILQLKNKSDVNVLFLETQKLYEKLAILKFIQDNFGEVKPTIGQAALEIEVEKAFDKLEISPEIVLPASAATIEEVVTENDLPIETFVTEILEEVAPESSIKETIISEIEAPKNEIPSIEDVLKEEEKPILEAIVEEVVATEEVEIQEPETVLPSEEIKQEVIQISFEELLGGSFTEPLFVKADSIEASKTNATVSPFDLAFDKVETLTEEKENKPKSLNEKLSKGINIDLNDRIGFVKHLFGNSNEDYNRVLSQLNSFNNFYETKTFIEEMIKPDYNNWEGKDDYANRFMEIVEKKFM